MRLAQIFRRLFLLYRPKRKLTAEALRTPNHNKLRLQPLAAIDACFCFDIEQRKSLRAFPEPPHRQFQRQALLTFFPLPSPNFAESIDMSLSARGLLLCFLDSQQGS